jgi:N utilization substance protein A
VREVLVDDDGKQATVIVPDDQLSLAIGREGQNARLAARLTGWRVDIKSETEFAEEEAESGYEEEEISGRCAAILTSGRRCPNAALPGSRYCGLDAHQALAGIDSDQVAALGGDAVSAEEVQAEEEALMEEVLVEEAEAEAPAEVAEPEAPTADEAEPAHEESPIEGEGDILPEAGSIVEGEPAGDGAAPVDSERDVGAEEEPVAEGGES